MVVSIKRKVCQVVHSLHISSFVEKEAQRAFHKQVIFIGATSGGLITLMGVLVIPSCFCFTSRTMLISRMGGGGGVVIKEFNFFFKNPSFISTYMF